MEADVINEHPLNVAFIVTPLLKLNSKVLFYIYPSQFRGGYMTMENLNKARVTLPVST